MDAVLDVEDVKLKDDPCLYVISNLVGENLSGEIYKTVRICHWETLTKTLCEPNLREGWPMSNEEPIQVLNSRSF